MEAVQLDFAVHVSEFSAIRPSNYLQVWVCLSNIRGATAAATSWSPTFYFHFTSFYPKKYIHTYIRTTCHSPLDWSKSLYFKMKLSIVNIKCPRPSPLPNTPCWSFHSVTQSSDLQWCQKGIYSCKKITSASRHFSWSPVAFCYLQLSCFCQLRLFLTPDLTCIQEKIFLLLIFSELWLVFQSSH